jgi:hypothetical protein
MHDTVISYRTDFFLSSWHGSESSEIEVGIVDPHSSRGRNVKNECCSCLAEQPGPHCCSASASPPLSAEQPKQQQENKVINE